MNPLLYVLGYGARFVAQGTPADMAGLTAIIEEAIRYPGFAFVNVQSPCVTFGEEDQQLKAHKAHDEDAREPGARPGGPDPTAMDLAQHYGTRALHRHLLPQPGPAADATTAWCRSGSRR